MTRLAELGWRRTSIAILILIVIGQTAYFYQNFFEFVVGPKTGRLLEVARLAERHTNQTDALLIVGDDWSSLVPYYSGRKSIALPGWAPADYLDDLLRDPSPFLGGAPLGGIVFCRDRLHDYGAQAPTVEAFMAGREQIGEAGGCALLAPARRDP